MTIVRTGMCLALVLVLAPGAGAQDKKETQEKKAAGQDMMQQMDPAMAEGMKKWQEAMTPGAPHKKIADMAGSWKVESKMWWNGPGTAPSMSEGKNEAALVLGGRFLATTYSASMMDMPFQGQGLLGYDNTKKKYVQTWVDNMSTAIGVAEGWADTTGNVLTLWGVMDEPMTGERDKPVKYVYRLMGKDKYVFELHDVAWPEPNTKVVEIMYTRVK